MLYNILGWYSLIIIILATLRDSFFSKNTSGTKLLSFIIDLPVVVFLYLALFR
jgi:hypothetical protein